MPKYLTCDVCGSDNDVSEDYDGDILCSYHRTEQKVKILERDHANLLRWVKDCWVSELIKMKKEIKELKKLNEPYKYWKESTVNISVKG